MTTQRSTHEPICPACSSGTPIPFEPSPEFILFVRCDNCGHWWWIERPLRLQRHRVPLRFARGQDRESA
jgi:hypothetical protein